jgi:hypothetical protein
MKEGNFHIHLVDIPTEERGKGKNQSNIIHLSNRRKGLSVVDAFLLRKSFRNQVRFMMLKKTFRGKFGLIDPSTFHNALPLR